MATLRGPYSGYRWEDIVTSLADAAHIKTVVNELSSHSEEKTQISLSKGELLTSCSNRTKRMYEGGEVGRCKTSHSLETSVDTDQWRCSD